MLQMLRMRGGGGGSWVVLNKDLEQLHPLVADPGWPGGFYTTPMQHLVPNTWESCYGMCSAKQLGMSGYVYVWSCDIVRHCHSGAAEHLEMK